MHASSNGMQKRDLAADFANDADETAGKESLQVLTLPVVLIGVIGVNLRLTSSAAQV